MKKTFTAVVPIVLALSLSACGGNDEAEASKNISAQIMKSQKSGTANADLLDLQKKEADCIGDGFVKDIGVENLREYKLINEENKATNEVTNVKMKAADAKSASSVLFDCTDVEAMVKKAIGESGGVPEQMQPCIDKTLTKKTLQPMFAKVFEGKADEAQKSLTEPLTKCAMGNLG